MRAKKRHRQSACATRTFLRERIVTKDEIIATIQKCAEELGHVPTLDELLGKTTISKHKLRKNFGPYVKALAACGLERHGCGYKIGMENLFLDWGAVVRKLGKTPSMLDYELHENIRPRGWCGIMAAGHTCRQDCWAMPESGTWKTTGRM